MSFTVVLHSEAMSAAPSNPAQTAGFLQRGSNTVSLLDRIDNARPEPRNVRLTEWLASLTAAEVEAVEGAALDRDWSNARLSAFLKNEGVAAGKDTIAVWRKELGYRG